MMKGNKYMMPMLAALLFMGAAGLAHAQEDTLKVETIPSIFDQKMQRRYVPSDQPFYDNQTGFLRALENTSVSVAGSYRRWLDKDMSSGPMLSVAISKWFTPQHGIRLEAGAGYFFENISYSRVKILPDVRLSHLFNLSAWLDGYDAYRRGNLYTLAGVGYSWEFVRSRGSQPARGGWTAQLGAGFDYRIARGVSLFVEPVFELNGNGFLQREDGNWRGYYGGFRGTVGLSYRVDRWNTLLTPRESHRWFVEASAGPSLLLASSYPYKFGYNVQLGVGEWITPDFSVRLSGAWTQVARPSERQFNSTYGSVRLEGIYDFLARGEENRPFGLSLLLGPEANILNTTEEDPYMLGAIGILKGRRAYLGATGGVQFRARLYKRLSAILEPRVSVVPYLIRSQEEGLQAQNSLDVLFSANLGLQYAFRNSQERQDAWERARILREVNEQRRKEELERRAREQALRPAGARFTPQRFNLYASLEGSYFRPLGRAFAFGPLASVSVGTWFDDVDGMLVNAGLGYFQDLVGGNGYVKTSEFSAAYLFNVTNFAKGFDPDRQASLSVLAGLGYMLPIKEQWKGSMVVRTGVDLRMHVLPRTDVVLRPEIDLLYAPTNRWTPALRGTMGLSYNMGSAAVSSFVDDGRKWYVGVGGGYGQELVQAPESTEDGTPLGEYRLSVALGRHYSPRMDWRVSFSYISMVEGGGFVHRLRYATVNIDALYNLVGSDLVDRRWSLSLVGGPEIGLQHKGNPGENNKGSGLILHRPSVSAYIGASGGVQAKYSFASGLAFYLEPRYTLVPYVAKLASGAARNAYSHHYGVNLGLEYAFGRDPYAGYASAPSRGEYQPYTFIQLTATAMRPFGRGYSNGPVASIGVGHWFRGASGILVDAGLGYFYDNQLSTGTDGRSYGPQHMKTAEARLSYLLNINRLASLNPLDAVPVEASLMAGVGYMVPEIMQASKGSFEVHGGFDLRMHILRGTDLVFQPQLELMRDPHTVVDGTRKDIRGAFRGTFGLSYNISRQGPVPTRDPGKDWFIDVVGGVQKEYGRLPQGDTPPGVFRNEYRVGLYLGRHYTNALAFRVGGSFSELIHREYTFLHSLRYVSANLDVMYDLLANADGTNRVSLYVLGGPEAGLFNKNYSGSQNERPMAIPLRIGNRRNHGVAGYIGLSAGAQLKVKLFDGKSQAVSLFVEPRYSLVPYVTVYDTNDHRTFYSQLFNVNLGLQYSFGRR